LAIVDLSLKQAEESLEATEKAAPLDMNVIERNQRIAKEDLKQFAEVERTMSVKVADFMVQMAKDQVEYEQEELRQLEKMYKAGDVTEETEKIVLKRARDQVKRAKFSLEMVKTQRDEFIKFAIPRREEKIKETAQRSDIELARAKITFPMALSKLRLDVEKLRIQRSQMQERLQKLSDDRNAMTIKSPIDGILYYGKCVRGKWSGGTSGETMRRGSGVMPNEVVMTVVQPRPLVVRVTVPEAQLQNVHGGLKATVEPAGYSDQKLSAIVDRVSPVPISSGSFDGLLTVALDSQAEALMPGMTCEVKLVPYKKKDALTVPPKAVFSDELDPQKRFVYIAGKTDKEKPQKRDVTVGKHNEKQAEILKGLAVGDEVLLERPKDE
jgi:HlyD family secretion protein